MKRKGQFRKQQIATVGVNSTKHTRRMDALVQKIERVRAMDKARS